MTTLIEYHRLYDYMLSNQCIACFVKSIFWYILSFSMKHAVASNMATRGTMGQMT